MKHFRVNSSDGGFSGLHKVPGDKSISHRCVMLGSIANGESNFKDLLLGEDVQATMNAFRTCGIQIDENGENVRIQGKGLFGLTPPKEPIDCGNSGTSMRLLTGLFSGQSFETILLGDESLSARPMLRVVKPLRLMGASIELSALNTAPIVIRPVRRLRPITWKMPVASAQVKSSILLAGLFADGQTSTIEPLSVRNHTNVLLHAYGGDVLQKGSKISVSGGVELTGQDIQIPADFSSAAFFIVAALLNPESDITFKSVGINPTRTGLLTVLEAMGGSFEFLNRRELGGEPVCDLRVRSCDTLSGTVVEPTIIPTMIDEIPILAIAAAAAQGQTALTGCADLRNKESDRIHAVCRGLEALNISVQENADGMIIEGGQISGGIIDSFGDHRIAMSFAIAGCIASSPVIVKNVDCVDTSFPGFAHFANGVGLDLKVSAGT